jgi:GDP-L-fucose synthase
VNLRDKTIVITGGGGFLGSHLADLLAGEGCRVADAPRERRPVGDVNVWIPRSKSFDLTVEGDVRALYEATRPDVVIHLAAICGGIGINREKPGTFYYKNLMMGALLMEYARIHRVEKFVAVGTICAYPKHTPVPFREEQLWSGYPEETNAPYGIAKKVMLVQAQAYRQEFGLNAIYLLPVNLYGPRDNFDPRSSHVIPALIRKCVEARDSGAPEIEIWGTGQATREFLYVEDAARAIALATERYDGADPVNIGSGSEIAIHDLVRLIVELTGYTGAVRWNSSYPDGQPRRMLECSRAKAAFRFEAKTDFLQGLSRTIHWYERHRPAATT